MNHAQQIKNIKLKRHQQSKSYTYFINRAVTNLKTKSNVFDIWNDDESSQNDELWTSIKERKTTDVRYSFD